MTMKILSSLPVFALVAAGLALHGIQQKTPAPAVRPVHDIKVSEGPLVNLISAKEAVVSWSTNLSTDTVLAYGTSESLLDHVASAPWGGIHHTVRLKNLAPDTDYYYRVGKPSTQETEAMLEVRHFKTPPSR